MPSKQLKRLIGIDFGTSASVVCYKDYPEDGSTDLNAPTNLAWGLRNSSTLPTLIYSDEEGRKYYGYDADQRGISKPDKLIANFKMDLVNPDATKRKQAGELLQEFLHFLYEAYERQTTTPPNTEIFEEIYISYPAKWPAEIRQITVKAAQTAGFPNVKGMDEPSAAMRYLLSTDTQDIRNLTKAGIIQTGKPLIILLIDMGAGTTDLVLYRYVPGEVSDINVLATWPTVEETATFGGGEIDKILATILKDYLEKHSQPPITIGEDRLSRLMSECKDWKERILAPSLNDGVTPEEPITIDNYKAMVGVGFDRHFDVADRTSFGNILRDYLPTFPHLINGLLAMAEKNGLEDSAEQIDLVVLTGGHSQWYFVKEILCGNWVSGLEGEPDSGSGVNLTKIKQEPFRIVTTPRPQETVARGLAMSGVPLKIRKLATNSTWLKFKINQEFLKPIELLAKGEILPTVRAIFVQHLFSHGILDNINVKAFPLSGDTIEKAMELSPIDLTMTVPLGEKLSKVAIAALFFFMIPFGFYWDGKGFTYIQVEIDEDENWNVKGIFNVKTGFSNLVKVFAINRPTLTKEEENKLADALDKEIKKQAEQAKK